mgnify:CR=1 FL=1
MSTIHPTAIVDPAAQVADGVEIGMTIELGPALVGQRDISSGSGSRGDLVSSSQILSRIAGLPDECLIGDVYPDGAFESQRYG